jgi:hypothetical protein
VSQLDPILVRGLLAIEPYLSQVVVVGGWVPHIYELLYDAAKAGHSPRTADIDIAVPRRVEVSGSSINELLTAAHFICEFRSLSVPPVTKYVATDPDQDAEIEFITDAPGGPEAVVHVQPELTAQALHYVRVLLENPWQVDLREASGGALSRDVVIAKPGAFIFQKALSFKNCRCRCETEPLVPV